MTKENSAPSRTLADLDRCPKCKSADFSKTVGAYKYYCNQCGYQFMEPLAPEAATKEPESCGKCGYPVGHMMHYANCPDEKVAPGEAVRSAFDAPRDSPDYWMNRCEEAELEVSTLRRERDQLKHDFEGADSSYKSLWESHLALDANWKKKFDDKVAELEAQVAWKKSAMEQLGKVDALKAELPAKYLGWDAYEATVEYVRELRSTVERLEGEIKEFENRARRDAGIHSA